MWTPQTVLNRIVSQSLLADAMFTTFDADALLDQRDQTLDDGWVRAAKTLQAAWDRHPDAIRMTPAIDAVREAAFKRVFAASGGNHDLAAVVSDDFELICRRALLGVDVPFILMLQEAYDSQQIPHQKLTAQISESYIQDLGFSAVFQMLLLLLTALGAIDGQLLMWVLYSLPIYWLMAFVMIARRPQSPTRVDLMVIRYGFFVILVAVVSATMLRWTLAGMAPF